MKKFLERLAKRRFLEKAKTDMPFDAAISIIERLFSAQGVGSGGSVKHSGEQGVFELVQRERPVLVDVGGHIGDYSAAFLRRFPDARVFFVEPSENHLVLAREALGSSVTYLPVALSDHEHYAKLYKNADISGLASLTKRRLDHFGIHMTQEERVQCRTLDSVCGEFGLDGIDLLKIDVEGHELDVLNGAMNSLKRGIVKVVQFEFGGCNLDTRSTLQDFFYLFKGIGYDIYLVHPSGQLIPLPKYREIYEQYVTTNYVAMLQS